MEVPRRKSFPFTIHILRSELSVVEGARPPTQFLHVKRARDEVACRIVEPIGSCRSMTGWKDSGARFDRNANHLRGFVCIPKLISERADQQTTGRSRTGIGTGCSSVYLRSSDDPFIRVADACDRLLFLAVVPCVSNNAADRRHRP